MIEGGKDEQQTYYAKTDSAKIAGGKFALPHFVKP